MWYPISLQLHYHSNFVLIIPQAQSKSWKLKIVFKFHENWCCQLSRKTTRIEKIFFVGGSTKGPKSGTYLRGGVHRGPDPLNFFLWITQVAGGRGEDCSTGGRESDLCPATSRFSSTTNTQESSPSPKWWRPTITTDFLYIANIPNGLYG